MKKHTIGEDAGIVWRALQGRRLTWEELSKTCKLDERDLAFAIGWLARENNISFLQQDGTLYYVGYREHYY